MPRRRREVQRSNAVSATVGMIIILVALSAAVPAIMASTDGESTQRLTFTQSEGERVTLTGGLEATLVEVNSGTTGNVNVTIEHVETGETNSTGTVDGGNSTTVVIDGRNVTVSVGEVIDSESATITYEYPLSLGLPKGASVIVDNVPLILLLATVMLLSGVIMAVVSRLD